jgi:hypothetical protein
MFRGICTPSVYGQVVSYSSVLSTNNKCGGVAAAGTVGIKFECEVGFTKRFFGKTFKLGASCDADLSMTITSTPVLSGAFSLGCNAGKLEARVELTINNIGVIQSKKAKP